MAGHAINLWICSKQDSYLVYVHKVLPLISIYTHHFLEAAAELESNDLLII